MPRPTNDLFDNLDGTPDDDQIDALDAEDDDIDELEAQRKPAKAKPAKSAKAEDVEEEEEDSDIQDLAEDSEEEEEPEEEAEEAAEAEPDEDLKPTGEFDEDVDALALPKAVRADIQKLVDTRVGTVLSERNAIKTKYESAQSKMLELEDAITNLCKENLKFEEKELRAARRAAVDEGDSAAIDEVEQKMADFNFRKLSFERLAKDQELERSRAKQPETAAPEQPQRQANPLADAWVGRNPWYNKPGFERKTAMANAIDKELAAEGMNTRDPAYFRELSKRLEEAMPTKVADTKRPSPAPVQKKTSPVAAKPGAASKTAAKPTIDKNDEVFRMFNITPDKRAMKLLAAERRTK